MESKQKNYIWKCGKMEPINGTPLAAFVGVNTLEKVCIPLFPYF